MSLESICSSIRQQSSDFLDCRCTKEQAAEVHRHLTSCPNCAARMDELMRQRKILRQLSPRMVPADLAVSLRVVASKEASRRRLRRDWRSRLELASQRARLFFDNLMRPLAVPAMGGVATALVLFATISSIYPRIVQANDDVPTALYQSAELSSLGPFGMLTDGITIEVSLDGQGRVISYSVPDSERALLQNGDFRRSLENNLLFMRFKPANFFGMPTQAKVKMTIRHSQLEVKG